MDKLNTKANKIEKIKVRIDSSSDSVIQQLKEQLNNTKIQLSIKNSPSGNEIFKLICPLFSSFNNLLSLTFELDNEFNLELSPFLEVFKQLKNLEQLTILLNQNGFINQESELGIGEAISDSINLKSLNLRIYDRDKSHLNFLSLENAYKKLKKLENLNLWIDSIHTPKQLTYIFKGLRYSQNLSTLSIKLAYCSNISFNLGLKIFCEELKEMKNLRQFDMLDENFFWQENYQIHIGNCIKYLENLEKLSLKIPFDNNEQNVCIEGIQQLKFLKELTIFALFRSQTQLQNYSNIIAQCQHLENVNLYIRLISWNHSLQQISSSLKQIKNITKLKIVSFAETSQKEIIIFILSLQNQKKLVNLSISYNEINVDYDFIDLALLEKCRDQIKNLEQFQVKTYGEALVSIFWSPLVCEIPSLKEIKIICTTSSWKTQKQSKYQLISLDQLILNKKDLLTMKLQFYEAFKFEQNSLLKFFQQLSINLNLCILDLNFKRMIELDIDDSILKELSHTLTKCNKLTSLNLIFGKNNNFSSQGVQMLNQGLKQLQDLKRFQIHLNKIYLPSNDLEILFESIKYLKSLRELYIEYRIQFNNEESKGINGYVELPENLKTISFKIRSVQLIYDQIRGLMQGLLSLNKLQNLSLKIDVLEFEQQELVDLQRVLGNLTNLKEITINCKSFLLLNLFKLFSDLKLLTCLTLYSKFKKVIYTTYLEKLNQNNCIGNNQFTKLDDQFKFSFNYIERLLEQDLNILNNIFQSCKLKSLYLSIRQENEIINKKHSELFFSTFQNLSNLRKLYLDFKQDKRVIQDYFLFFGQSIQFLTHLNELVLVLDIKDDYQYDNYPLEQLVDKLYCLSNLNKIEFKTNQSSLKELHLLLQGIRYLSNLRSILIEVKDMNTVGGNFYTFKLDEFSNLNKVQIHINQNNLESITQFYKSMRNLQNLRVLVVNPTNLQKNYLLKIIRLVKITN